MDKKIEGMTMEEIKKAVMEGMNCLPTEEFREQIFMGTLILMIM